MGAAILGQAILTRLVSLLCSVTDMRRGSGTALAVLVSCIFGDRRMPAKWPSTKSVSLLQVKEKTEKGSNALTKVTGDDMTEDIMREMKSLPAAPDVHQVEFHGRGIDEILDSMHSYVDSYKCADPSSMRKHGMCCSDDSKGYWCESGWLSIVSGTECGSNNFLYVCVPEEVLDPPMPTPMVYPPEIEEMLRSLDTPPADGSTCAGDSHRLDLDEWVCCAHTPHAQCAQGFKALVSKKQCSPTGFLFVCVQ